jgi:hypothetical protein
VAVTWVGIYLVGTGAIPAAVLAVAPVLWVGADLANAPDMRATHKGRQ